MVFGTGSSDDLPKQQSLQKTQNTIKLQQQKNEKDIYFPIWSKQFLHKMGA